MPVTESDIENAFVTYAKGRGCIAVKLRIDGQNGFPDRTVLTTEGVFFAEFKTPSGRLRPMQRVWKKLLESLGFVVLTPRRVGEAEDYLDVFLKG